MLEHGGKLLRAAQHYGIPVADWIDLSTGINPEVYPVPPLGPACWNRLPEDDDGLEAAAAAYYGEYRDEIDAEIAANEAEYERGRAAAAAGEQALRR